MEDGTEEGAEGEMMEGQRRTGRLVGVNRKKGKGEVYSDRPTFTICNVALLRSNEEEEEIAEEGGEGGEREWMGREEE